jgi:hypothetical protein
MEKQIEYLKDFAFKLGEGAQLSLDGECGFGRECVGILCNGNWVDYDYECGVPTPDDAYHKHDCIAVLGRGEDAISQLYNWCRAFENAGFVKVALRENPTLKDMPLSTRQMMAIMGTAVTPQIVRE